MNAPITTYGGQICVLPTKYKGVLFRSRLEARWAVYFDLLGVKWQYEPEGYQLSSGNYCPDFFCESFFVEIKPTYDALLLVEPKLSELARITKTEVYGCVGAPSLRLQNGYWWDNDGKLSNFSAIFCAYAFKTKSWGSPYIVDDECFSDDDEEEHIIASNWRFENGVG